MENSTSSSQQPSADPTEYADFVLYYKPKHEPCERLKAQVLQSAQTSEVILKNVDDIPQKPPWLTGVPLAVPFRNFGAHKAMQPVVGSAAIGFVESWLASRLQPASMGAAFAESRVPAASLDDVSFHGADDAPVERDQGTKLSMSLEELLRLRGGGQPQEG